MTSAILAGSESALFNPCPLAASKLRWIVADDTGKFIIGNEDFEWCYVNGDQSPSCLYVLRIASVLGLGGACLQKINPHTLKIFFGLQSDMSYTLLVAVSKKQFESIPRSCTDTQLKYLSDFIIAVAAPFVIQRVWSQGLDDLPMLDVSGPSEACWVEQFGCPKTEISSVKRLFLDRVIRSKKSAEASNIHMIAFQPDPLYYECTARWWTKSKPCGAKFDDKESWKRHENMHQPAPKFWRCEECRILFFRSELFKQHLTEAHGADEKRRSFCLENHYIGGYGQVRFWCGFCVELIDLKKEDLDAWNERLDHIAQHFDRGDGYSHWVLPDKREDRDVVA